MKQTLILLFLVVSIFVAKPVLAQDNPSTNSQQVEDSMTGEDMLGADGEVLDDYTEQAPVDEAPFQEYSRAKIIQIKEEKEQSILGTTQFTQNLKIKILSGSEKDQEKEIEFKDLKDKYSNKKLAVGDSVAVAKIKIGESVEYQIIDRYRMPQVAVIVLIFVILAIFLARLRGALAIVGLAVTVVAVWKVLLPQILAGHNPLLITLAVAIGLAIIVMYLTHGPSRRTSLALTSTLTTLIIASGLAILFVWFTKLFGLTSEETSFVQTFFDGAINLKGLLLSGIILGTLGILDDITVSQTMAVHELSKANEAYGVKELYKSAISMGREHIASLINTLFLIYAGVSLPLFLLFSVKTSQPAWILFNSEFITEEIVRTLVGSIALMLAVPIATALAAYYYGKRAKHIEAAPEAVSTATPETHS